MSSSFWRGAEHERHSTAQHAIDAGARGHELLRRGGARPLPDARGCAQARARRRRRVVALRARRHGPRAAHVGGPSAGRARHRAPVVLPHVAAGRGPLGAPRALRGTFFGVLCCGPGGRRSPSFDPSAGPRRAVARAGAHGRADFGSPTRETPPYTPSTRPATKNAGETRRQGEAGPRARAEVQGGRREGVRQARAERRAAGGRVGGHDGVCGPCPSFGVLVPVFS